MDEFDRNGIKVIFQDYVHPEYKQNYPGFEPYMSAVDLLFNHGPDSFRIMNENQTLQLK